MLDALIVGKGPAALAAAAALAERGLGVGILGPPGPLQWTATYGAWLDELHDPCCPEFVESFWPRAVAATGAARHTLDRAYARVDTDALAEWLVGRCVRGGVRWMDGEAAAVEHDARASVVRWKDGGEAAARVVIDASGHRPALVRRPERPGQAFQTAYGRVLETDRHPFAPDEAVLMDWSAGHLPAGERRRGVPSFLYAFPLADGRLFVEETVLAARPAVSADELRRRLELRLASLGIAATGGVEGEREVVWIPMGGALPPPQRVVGFGAAAGMVHPATGYSLVRSLSAASALADAVARELGTEGGSPESAARAAWEAVWPADGRRRFALFRFGMEVLLRLDGEETGAFFDAFFSLPADEWSAYLGDRLTADELMRLMGRLFARVPPAVRRKMALAAAGPPGMRLAAALVRP